MATQIKFGTSGWRAVMAEEFMFANVHRAVQGIARYVESQKSNRARVEVIVGRDPRSSTRLPKNARSSSARPLLASNILANSSSRTRY